MNSLPAMAAFDRPSAIGPRTSRSRAASWPSGSFLACLVSSWAVTSGSMAVPPGGDPADRVEGLADVGHPVLEQVPGAGVPPPGHRLAWFPLYAAVLAVLVALARRFEAPWTLPRPARAVVVLLAAGFGLDAAATLAPGLVS